MHINQANHPIRVPCAGGGKQPGRDRPDDFQVLNVLSSAGASVLGVGFLLPAFYLFWSLKFGPKAPANPWGAVGLEWQIPSPPTTHNFEEDIVVTHEAYDYPGKQSEIIRQKEAELV